MEKIVETTIMDLCMGLGCRISGLAFRAFYVFSFGVC